MTNDAHTTHTSKHDLFTALNHIKPMRPGRLLRCGPALLLAMGIAFGLAACGGGDPAMATAAADQKTITAAASGRASSLSASTTADVQTAAGANASVPGAITLPHPTLQNVSVEWAFSGDANANAVVSVRYRKAGATAWSQAMPLRRIQAGSAQGYKWPTRHSGSVLDLQPGTTYNLKLSLSDPDGGSVTRTVNVTTRSVPVPWAGGTLRHATPGTLASVINATQPGDIVELAAGNYGNIDWTADGVAGKPVVLRPSNAGGAVINGEIYLYNRQHVILDGLTVNGRIRFNASNFIAITRCTVNAKPNIGDGIGIVAYLDSEDAYLADNVVTGTTVWRESSFGSSGDNFGTGIALGGPGHVIMNNRVSGFRDDIALLDLNEAAHQYSIDILNNDVSVAGDDGIQPDFCHHNCRIMRNRITNVFVGTSSQPSLGGPTYFIRNVIYNAVLTPFKLHNGSSGNVLLHNTVVKNGDAFGIYSGTPIPSLTTRNNLFIGGPGGTYNGYNNGDGHTLEIWDLATTSADMNHDAMGSTLGTFSGHFGHTAFASLAQLKSISTEKNALQIDLGVFNKTVAYPATPTRAYAVPDLRLKPGSEVQDTGEVLPNVNDGFAGAAPDAGAYELGSAMPVYGPR